MKNWRIAVLALLFFLAFYGVFMEILSGWGAPILFVLLFAVGLASSAFYPRVRDILRAAAISISIAAIFTHLISYLPSADRYYRHHQRDFWPDLFLIAFICSGLGVLVGMLARVLVSRVKRMVQNTTEHY
ncbi:hypothetical protein D3C72_1319510 [compost metagenome]